MTALLLLFAAYLLGSVSFAILISRLYALQDPRHYGSGNPGATNILRSGNKLAALLTLFCDALKGFVPIVFVKLFLPNIAAPTFLVLLGLAAVLGHLWPVFFKFKGGKGVATGLGFALALNLYLGLIILVTWLLVAVLFRYSSLAALLSIALMPFYYYLLISQDVINLALMSFLAMLLIYRHKNNIRNLYRGTESKIGDKAKSSMGHHD